MALRSGSLVSPNSIFKEPPRTVLRGTFLTHGGYPFERVFVKLLGPTQKSVEAVCAWLGRELGVPIPEPVFVSVQRSRVPNRCPWPYDQETAICFGTIEIPQAMPILRHDGVPVTDRLVTWTELVVAMVFDHLIANDDRSEENLLIDGRGKLWLIDHDRALGGLGDRLFSGAFPIFTNMFLERLRQLPVKNRVAIRGKLLESCAQATVAVERIPFRELGVPDDLEAQMRQFLRARASVLGQLLSDELGFPELFRDTTGSPGAGDIVH